MRNTVSLRFPAEDHMRCHPTHHAVLRMSLASLAAATFGTVSPAVTAPSADIPLPPPQTEVGKPLMQVLRQRHTSREFKSEPLPQQILSNLLWAAFGVNRPGAGGRTAPSAHDAQDIDVYVVTAEGVYRYDAKTNALIGVRTGDLRALTGVQGFVKDAPVNLLYVSDFSRFSQDDEVNKTFYSAADAGHISENVYLYGASENLAVMVCAYIDKPLLAKALGLNAQQRIVLAQSVGYPK